MTNVGITRIHITDQVSGRGAWRFRESRKRWMAANNLYRFIFNRLGTPLLPGVKTVQCTKEEFIAGYDHALGIDVILSLVSGQEITLQEKFLLTTFKTVTVEYMQNPRTSERGDWFNMKAQLYFVGYDRIKALSFQDWILLNWLNTQMEPSIEWGIRSNDKDGAKANFKWAGFNQFPPSCVVASSDDCKFDLTSQIAELTEKPDAEIAREMGIPLPLAVKMWNKHA